jgi:hypothetical protein
VHPLRPVLLPVLAACAALLLTGCGAGFGAQSVQTYAPSDGALADNGSIRVLNALVVAEEGSSTGVISMSLANHGNRDDRLSGITSSAGTVNLTGAGDLPAGSSVRFGAGTSPSATIDGLKRRPGENMTLRLSFTRSGPITVRTVVVPASGDYAEVTVAPSTPAAESSSPTATESPSPSPTSS